MRFRYWYLASREHPTALVCTNERLKGNWDECPLSLPTQRNWPLNRVARVAPTDPSRVLIESRGYFTLSSMALRIGLNFSGYSQNIMCPPKESTWLFGRFLPT